jgi:hypothetical protein
MDPSQEASWLLLIHQIPPRPGYFRVKIWRKLQKLGAVAIKNSVYVLPRGEQAHEDLEWVLREIVEGGGDVLLCEAQLAEGLTDEQVRGLFHAAREADYGQIAEEARPMLEAAGAGAGLDEEQRSATQAALLRLKRRFSEVTAIDFFGAPGREEAEDLLARIETRLREPRPRPDPACDEGPGAFRGRTWVTRQGIHVDRMASAWLIRRFIDPEAQFRFVREKRSRPRPGELRFDMFQAEYTHEGDRCTFEVLLERFGLDEPALSEIGEIVHEIDLKDSKFGRAETAGVACLVAGIALAHPDDGMRLERSGALFDDLCEYFRRKRPHKGESGGPLK